MNPIEIILLDEKIKYEKEYIFTKKNKYRFDFAVPGHKIAIEYEGGVYNRGRHLRPMGYIRDCKKYNLAVLEGWKVLRYTVEDLKNTGLIISQIKELMGG